MIYAYDKGPSGLGPPGNGGEGWERHRDHAVVPGALPRADEALPIKPWADSGGIVFEIAGGGRTGRGPNLWASWRRCTRSCAANGEAKLPFSYTVGPFRDRLAPDFAGAGKVTLVAAHLHGHHMLKRYETGLVRGGKQEPFGVIPAYRGYGPDQSFHPLPLGVERDAAPVTMGPDDVMYITCTFDTSDASGDWVDYGVAHGAEMCGQILYYHPFVSKAGGDGGARQAGQTGADVGRGQGQRPVQRLLQRDENTDRRRRAGYGGGRRTRSRGEPVHSKLTCSTNVSRVTSIGRIVNGVHVHVSVTRAEGRGGSGDVPSGDGDFLVGLALRPVRTRPPWARPSPPPPPTHRVRRFSPGGHAKARHHRVRGGARADARPGEGLAPGGSGSVRTRPCRPWATGSCPAHAAAKGTDP